MENLSIIIWGIKTSKLLTLSPCLVYGTMYMFPIPGTHFTSNMHYPSREIHITSEMCSPTTRIKAICVSQVGEHISPGIFCFLGRGRDSTSDECSPTWETHILSEMCSFTRET